MILRSVSRPFGDLGRCPIKQSIKHFGTPAALARKQMPPRPAVSEESIEESFLKGSGPGGQKINKTSSAVQLKHIPTGLVVKSQATRSRTQNRKIARNLLAEKLEEVQKGSESRRGMKAEVAKKRKASKTKKAKRKYRKQDREKGAVGTDKDDDGDEIDDELRELQGEIGEGILEGDGRGDVNYSDIHGPEGASPSPS
ncbi:hypothetical protein FGG08_002331 [Glutinoglossum americanum]|uniref:Prokaryotic-type class I peptide chain release factors domain-containing protein n=1 Tax=Glutinoglossum americanum TaxID=1670608 RepID=A0A9P8IBW2_9PEZI|nr:hypothetical protein FGG08_002331 [Glutinoglossum americanum]